MRKEVVITGFDLVSPIGVGQEEFWRSLTAGTSGIGYFSGVSSESPHRPLTSEVGDFRPKDYVKPKKNIKVMSRDIQLGFVAVAMAAARAGLVTDAEEIKDRTADPERFGVIFGCDLIGPEISEVTDAVRAGVLPDGSYDFSTWGKAAMEKIMPLWMLKYLPNMPASHMSIALDARAVSNSPTLDRASSLAAIIEAVSVIERGDADVMVSGGTGNRANAAFLARGRSYHLAPWTNDPASVPRPFDADRCGMVLGEGSGAFILESEEFALARGAKPIARIRGFSRVTEPTREYAVTSEAVRRSITGAIDSAGLSLADVDHLNADGIGTVGDDQAEAAGIRAAVGDLPVFTAKGHFGNLTSGTGSVELAASLLALENGTLPPVRNCEKIADDCPINVIVGKSHEVKKPAFIKINQTNMGRSLALVVEKY